MEQNIEKTNRSESVKSFDSDVPKTGEQVMEDMKGSYGLMKEKLQAALARFEEVELVLRDMKLFCSRTSNMFIKIKHGVERSVSLSEDAMKDLKLGIHGLDWLDNDMNLIDGVLERSRKEKACIKDTSHNATQTDEAVETPATHHGKRDREFSLSPVEAGSSKPVSKKLRIQGAAEVVSLSSKKAEMAAEPAASKVSRRKSLQKRARPEAVLIKPAEGQNYAEVLKGLKRNVSPDALGVQIKGVRETRNGGVLVELGPTGKGRAELSAAIKEAVGDRGSVRELVPRVEVEVFDLDTTTDEEDVKAALNNHFKDSNVGEVKISLTKRPFRGTLRAFVELREDLAMRLLRSGHLKVGWVSCRVQMKVEKMQCYRCLGFGHMAAGCKGPDRKNVCWRCGEEGHRAATCENTPQCYLCAEKEGKPRTDHRPGTMRCLAFREAASMRKPPGRPR